VNILLIHSDQHRYDCIAAHGVRSDIQTPNLDRLQQTGTSFSRAYSTIPICTPARASLLTGAWPTRHGSFCIPTAELDRAARPELPTIFQCLKQAGYATGWVGKYHRELDIPNDPGSSEGVDEFVPLRNYGKYCEANGISREITSHGLFGDENTETPPEETSLAWQACNVIRLLDQNKEKPFFIRWDPPEPHLPCRPSSEFSRRYESETMQPWQSFPDELVDKPATQKRQKLIWGLEGWTWEQWQPLVRLYYGIITELDHHIGRVLDQLDALGLTEDTLIIYSTDHGDYCGGHGQLDKHFNMYDDVTRVPLILSHPPTVPMGATCDAFSSNSIDIARTILESTGIEIPDTFQGEDLVRMAAETTHRPRDVAYSQYFGTESGAYSCRMIRDDRYKFVYHPVGDCHEFYDLQEDPGELHNQIDNPKLAEDISRLKARLWEVMEANGDRLANAWTAVELKGEPAFSLR
jgi:arylsulfatase A-like enzyme